MVVAVGSPQKYGCLQELPPAPPAPPSRASPLWVRQLSDDRASRHQQLPLCQPPKPLPVPLQIREGEDVEASIGANCQRRAGKKKKSPTWWGFNCWGVQTSPHMNIAQSRVLGEPLCPFLGPFHLSNLPTDLHQNAWQEEPRGISWPIASFLPNQWH